MTDAYPVRPATGGSAACAVVRSDTSKVFVAQDEFVLTRVLALQLVAQLSPSKIEPGRLESIRDALTEERWSDALAAWMEATGEVIDAFPDERVWTNELLDKHRASFEIRMAPIFRGDDT